MLAELQQNILCAIPNKTKGTMRGGGGGCLHSSYAAQKQGVLAKVL